MTNPNPNPNGDQFPQGQNRSAAHPHGVTNSSRAPAGTPTGGQFAPGFHSEPAGVSVGGDGANLSTGDAMDSVFAQRDQVDLLQQETVRARNDLSATSVNLLAGQVRDRFPDATTMRFRFLHNPEEDGRVGVTLLAQIDAADGTTLWDRGTDRGGIIAGAAEELDLLDVGSYARPRPDHTEDGDFDRDIDTALAPGHTEDGSGTLEKANKVIDQRSRLEGLVDHTEQARRALSDAAIRTTAEATRKRYPTATTLKFIHDSEGYNGEGYSDLIRINDANGETLWSIDVAEDDLNWLPPGAPTDSDLMTLGQCARPGHDDVDEDGNEDFDRDIDEVLAGNAPATR